MKNEKTITKIYFVLYLIFAVLTFIGAGYVFLNKGEVNPGYAVIPSLFSVIFSSLWNASKSKK